MFSNFNLLVILVITLTYHAHLGFAQESTRSTEETETDVTDGPVTDRFHITTEESQDTTTSNETDVNILACHKQLLDEGGKTTSTITEEVTEENNVEVTENTIAANNGTTTTVTETTARPTTTQPRLCRDQLHAITGRNECVGLRQRGRCQNRNFESFMRENCALTCGFCRNVGNNGGCFEATICRTLVASCNIRANTFLRQVCPVTCNTCRLPVITRRPQNNNNRG